jgi:hypothetical protein
MGAPLYRAVGFHPIFISAARDIPVRISGIGESSSIIFTPPVALIYSSASSVVRGYFS